ncbi:hypothetical protein [Paraburkholderia sp. MM5482-R1]|uniref:hypothetical protein n=1 Tax=unclassified Paraburkholderia TaxID=2615204 RepID=UPI003D1B5D85
MKYRLRAEDSQRWPNLSATSIAKQLLLKQVRKKPQYSPSTIWVELRPGKRVPVLRDNKLALATAFNRFILNAAIALDDQCVQEDSLSFDSGVSRVAISMIKLQQFLGEQGRNWTSVDEEMLRDFRKWLLVQVRSQASSRNLLTAKRTVNYRLRPVYEFFWWAQEKAKLVSNMIGMEDSDAIPSAIISWKKEGPRSGEDGQRVFPLCYRRVGEGSRTSSEQYWATPDDVDRLESWFITNYKSAHPARRNTLILRLVQYTGWRRSSVLSLEVEQFSDAVLEAALAKGESEILITPPSQKNSGSKARPLSIAWFISVRNFIREERAALLAARGLTGSSDSGKLFLSDSGLPPLPRSITRDFTQAFRAIGAPKGSGLHSVRRLHGNEKARAVVEGFKSSNVAISWENVAPTLKQCLNHSSEFAWQSYVHAMTFVHAMPMEPELRMRLSQKESENQDLKTRLAFLETEYGGEHTASSREQVRRRVARLTAENRRLKKRLASLTKLPSGRGSQSKVRDKRMSV